jgi:hypothetical protein
MKYDLDCRAHNRRERFKEAKILKERANKYFKLGDFKQAITYYT